jgi:outer membrane protein assembly factor BamA
MARTSLTGADRVGPRIRALAALVAAALVAAPLPAQDSTVAAPDPAPWRTNYFPYLIANPATGLMLVAHLDHFRQADYFARVPNDAFVSVDAGLSAQGSRLFIGRFRAPQLVNGWRFALDAGASRESRFGYSGFLPTDSMPDHNEDRVHRTRYFLKAEITRTISGPLAIAAMAGVERTRWSRLPGTTAFAADYGDDQVETGGVGRLSLVLDARDREFLTSKGILAEAGVLFGGGGEHRDGDVVSRGAYGGWYAHLRGYLSPRSGTLLAARLAARSVGETATLQARNTLPGWEGDVDALGGPHAHRSVLPGRMAGRGLLLGSFEVRHNLLDVGDYGAVTVIGFLDGGRVFEAEDVSLTTRGWKVGGGGGLALRVLRSSLLVFNFAGGPAGFTFSMGTGWAF